jgi:hypothetical protein
MNEHRRRYAGIGIAEPLQNLGPPVDAVAVRDPQRDAELRILRGARISPVCCAARLTPVRMLKKERSLSLFVITPITWPVLLKTKSPPEGAKFADEHGNNKQHGANAS